MIAPPTLSIEGHRGLEEAQEGAVVGGARAERRGRPRRRPAAAARTSQGMPCRGLRAVADEARGEGGGDGRRCPR